ncbi:Mediator of RNA polymerase II transcription subunit 21 [Cladophialophora chaetospira]|uniref:Mediator of RNA polymerase II transcription subunit 21 n=1 Tax=Cladophialophora chaetospira TaxID=386627 RepID=A0AA38X2B3_9EURO|nr:Mediator of RNA polymerase II transcription subunit 21 [Cladophialophora chaetospira]
MSSDILTQLQTCYDQLLTQFFSTISYLSQRHPLVAPDPDPSDPFTNPPTLTATGAQTPNAADSLGTGINPGPEDTDRAPYPLRPVTTQTFETAQQDLAEDLVLKGQQIELLIARLPGIGRGEEQQAEEIKVLVEKVREMEARRKEKRKEMRRYVKRLENVVLGMAESVDYGNRNGVESVNGHG